MLKAITLSAVKLAAMLDIEVNNKTTSLSVKRILRELGVEAVQSEVSDLLLAAATQLPLESTSNGTYKEYQLPNPSAVADPSVTTNLSYIKRDGSFVAGTDDPTTLQVDDWIVSAVTLGDSKNIYFNGSFTRDEVRFAFSKLRDVAYTDTRASRN